jgi:hypothetical protein
MKIFLRQCCRQNQNTFLGLSDNMEIYDRARHAIDHDITRLMRFAYWITKAANTHRICNTYALSRQQWLRERACRRSSKHY